MRNEVSLGDLALTEIEQLSKLYELTKKKPLLVTNCGYFITHNDHYKLRQKDNCFLLVYLHKGSIEYYIDNKKHLIKEKSVLIIPNNQFIKINYLNDSTNARYFIYFNGLYADDYLSQLNLLNKQYFSVDETCGNIIIDIIKKIIDDFHINDLDIDVNRTYMLLKLLTVISDFQNEEYDSTATIINRIALKMNDEYDIPYSQKHYAHLAAMSHSTFLRNFKKYKNCTPMEYMNNIKIKKAKTFLSETNLPIGKIASSIGIDDPLYFSKFFKHATGQTPSEFRKNNKLLQ